MSILDEAEFTEERFNARNGDTVLLWKWELDGFKTLNYISPEETKISAIVKQCRDNAEHVLTRDRVQKREKETALNKPMKEKK